MTAKEARGKALSVNTSESSKKYQSAMASIKKASEKGEYDCWFYETMTPDLKTKLQSDGYVVGATQYERNEVMTKISWNESN